MRVVVSAGGTGGHIFPALAIINKIKQMEPNSEFLYIGTTDRMESTIIPNKGINYVGIEMMGLNRHNLLKNIKVIKSLTVAVKKCKKVIEDFKPDIVLGIGGYITYPVIKAAHSLGIKTFIHEQNSIPGLSNRILKNKASIIGVSLEKSLQYFNKNKVIYTGNPRGEEAINAKPIDKVKLGLSPSKKLILIVMGSLGSNTINNMMKNILPKFSDKNYEVLFVSGKEYYKKYKNISIPKNVKIVEFLDDMLGVMRQTNLIVSRAGASTIAEITAIGIPSILIPSPYVTHNHQYKNAKILEEAGASILIEEVNLNDKMLLDSIDIIINDEKKYNIMKKNSEKIGIKDSTTRIYNILYRLVYGDK